ncbi:hypothetical protein RND81_12G094000 [Saponaria officinalis]|uniref:Uncharacterized protein n=1 Tax=Saponaria officinalis TaxID=3572 RepID=A0AAW1H8F2_SAPOF
MLWDELDKFELLLSCTCRKCECDVDKKHALRRETDRLLQFTWSAPRPLKFCELGPSITGPITHSESSSVASVTVRANMVDVGHDAYALSVTVCGTPLPKFVGKWIIDKGCSNHLMGDFNSLLVSGGSS